MTSYARKIRSLRRRLLKHMTEVLEDLDKRLKNGESLGPKEMFTVIAGPLALEQLTRDKELGEVDLDVLIQTFEHLLDAQYYFNKD